MSTALEIIEALSAAGYEPDFKLTAGSGPTRVEFPVHRLLLASVSSVFACSAGRKRESKEEGDEVGSIAMGLGLTRAVGVTPFLEPNSSI